MVSVQEKRRFTVIDGNKNQGKSILASDKEGALSRFPYSVVIIDGTLGSIGGKRVPLDKKPKTAMWGGSTVEQSLKEGAVCTLVIDDPVVIPHATYVGEQIIDDENWLAFEKKGVRFWVDSYSLEFSRIDGKNVG